MNIRNKYLFKGYTNILLNNRIIIFCELNSLHFGYLKKLKANFQKEGFSLKHIKNSLFRHQFQNSNLDVLINGPVFILYKGTIGIDEDLKSLQHFTDYKFILCYFFKEKLYNFLILKKFKKISMVQQFHKKIFFRISTILSIELYNTIGGLEKI
jgi:hypothetical protein